MPAIQPITVNVNAALPTGAAIIGKVGIDQTTPGTTNGVQVNAALPAGANNIGDVDVLTLPALVAGAAIVGKVGIDQTTPGTTNGIQVNAALPAGANNIGDVDVLTMPVVTVNPKNPVLNSDVALNSSDKTAAVTAGKVWEILSIHVQLISEATAGNRQILVLFTNAADVVLSHGIAGATQAASLTYDYDFYPGADNIAAVYNTAPKIRNPIPRMILPAGYKIRVYDEAAIAAATDDMTVQILVNEETA